MSTILKRFEIWILLVLVFAGIWWAFQAEPVSTASTEPTGGKEKVSTAIQPSPEADSLIEVKKVNLTSTDQGTVIELTLFGRSGTDTPVALGNDTLGLHTAEGEGVDRFFLPFDPDPLLSADEKSLVTLKYWLKAPVDVLWLTYRDQTLKVEIPGVSI